MFWELCNCWIKSISVSFFFLSMVNPMTNDLFPLMKYSFMLLTLTLISMNDNGIHHLTSNTSAFCAMDLFTMNKFLSQLSTDVMLQLCSDFRGLVLNFKSENVTEIKNNTSDLGEIRNEQFVWKNFFWKGNEWKINEVFQSFLFRSGDSKTSA